MHRFSLHINQPPGLNYEQYGGTMKNKRKAPKGFTLIELLVVVLIIGILAAIAIPQYFKVVEKGKASEALAALDSIRSAQERYLAHAGTYCAAANFACPGWDMVIPTMKYFTMGAPFVTAAPSWSVALTRNASPAVYGAYVITYTINPGVQPSIVCNQANCQS